ncbi:Myosin-m heavy chain [Globisporangium polare]
MNSGMHLSRADARQFSGKATGDDRVTAQPLPLPKRFFPKVRLSSVMVREYQQTAKLLLDDALEQLRRERIYGGVDESWRDIGASHGFKRFTKMDGDVAHHRVQGVVRASLSGLMQVLYTENSVRFAECRRAFYNDHVDAQTLAVLKERSQENRNEHMVLRWMATELSNSSDTNRRDMCVLEYTGTTLDRENLPIGFKISHSIQLAECKSLKPTHGLLRRIGTDVLLVRPSSDNGHSEILLSGSSDAASEIPLWLLTNYLNNIATGLGKVPVVVQARCLANMPMLDKKFWVATADRKTCNVCVSKFGYLSKKHHCRSCGEVTCKSCIVTRSVGEESKFCKKCIIIATNQEEQLFHADRSDASGSIASRSSITSVSSATGSSSSYMSSSAGYMPPSTSKNAASTAKFHVDMKLLDDLRGGSNSLTASEDSYGSTSSSTLYMDQSLDYRHVSSLDEDNVMFVDTRRNLEASSNGYGQQPQSQSQPQQQQSVRGPKPSSTSYTQQYGSRSAPPMAPMHSSSHYSNNGSQPGYRTASRAPAPAAPVSMAPPAPPSSFQHVEDSIAHQRELLEKMMHQARYKQTAAYP